MWILLFVALLMFLLNSREHMTNSDLISTLKTFEQKGSTKKPEIQEAPIFGPKAEPVAQPSPSNSSNSGSGSGVYPDIYGPEYVGVPGSKPTKKNSKDSKDSKDSENAYEFNPDLKKAFQTNGPPQPFLTDFSKFQH